MKAQLRRIRAEGLLYVCNRLVSRVPSHRFRLFFYRRFMGFEIGHHSYIFMDAWFDCRKAFRMGNHSVVNQKCRLDPRGGQEIGDNVGIASETCILTADHDPQAPDCGGRSAPVRIEDYVVVGTRAMILRGVTIGRGAVVAAGAIVTKSVPPFAIVAGSPARQIGVRNQDLSYEINYDRLFA